jgi:hypothetical protein
MACGVAISSMHNGRNKPERSAPGLPDLFGKVLLQGLAQGLDQRLPHQLVVPGSDAVPPVAFTQALQNRCRPFSRGQAACNYSQALQKFSRLSLTSPEILYGQMRDCPVGTS